MSSDVLIWRKEVKANCITKRDPSTMTGREETTRSRLIRGTTTFSGTITTTRLRTMISQVTRGRLVASFTAQKAAARILVGQEGAFLSAILVMRLNGNI